MDLLKKAHQKRLHMFAGGMGLAPVHVLSTRGAEATNSTPPVVIALAVIRRRNVNWLEAKWMLSKPPFKSPFWRQTKP